MPDKDKAQPEKSTDWRKLPRVNPKRLKSKMVAVRFTEEEHDKLKKLAWDAEVTLADYIRAKCLGKRMR